MNEKKISIMDQWRDKTILELEVKIKEIDNQIAETEKFATDLVGQIKSTMEYASIEATHNGLLSFWGNKQNSENKLTNFYNLLKSLSDSMPNKPKIEQSKEEKEILEASFKVGAGYKQLINSIDNLKNFKLCLQGLIAEKKLNASTFLQREEKKEQASSTKPPKNNEKDDDYCGLKKGFYK